ncbi:LytR/AlgR family response regulator transcription factor [Flectobacillus major]|jgi:two-component system LytT family response regulator|uniref:LytR/AlgR family response regulator transcription factor n=1 Tax=Flectobacillus major TaxID=103 RepID=UPI0004243195|nr:LytTR family DNA-binding domain-containing protein [Flectobacillus major]
MNFENFCNVSQGKLDFKFQKIEIAIEDIVMLQADSNYTHLYLSNGERFIFSRTIKLFEDILKGHTFERIHKAFIINCSHLQGYDADTESLYLSNNLRASISRRRKYLLKRKLRFIN